MEYFKSIFSVQWCIESFIGDQNNQKPCMMALYRPYKKQSLFS